MATITIDGQEHDSDNLSEAARSQIMNIQVVDQKINQLSQDIAILQTARNAYASALKSELETHK